MDSSDIIPEECWTFANVDRHRYGASTSVPLPLYPPDLDAVGQPASAASFLCTPAPRQEAKAAIFWGVDHLSLCGRGAAAPGGRTMPPPLGRGQPAVHPPPPLRGRPSPFLRAYGIAQLSVESACAWRGAYAAALAAAPLRHLRLLYAHSGCVNDVAYAPESGRLLASASDDTRVLLWRSAGGGVPPAATAPPAPGGVGGWRPLGGGGRAPRPLHRATRARGWWPRRCGRRRWWPRWRPTTPPLFFGLHGREAAVAAAARRSPGRASFLVGKTAWSFGGTLQPAPRLRRSRPPHLPRPSTVSPHRPTMGGPSRPLPQPTAASGCLTGGCRAAVAAAAAAVVVVVGRCA